MIKFSEVRNEIKESIQDAKIKKAEQNIKQLQEQNKKNKNKSLISQNIDWLAED